ncbi:hypothetical protein H6P81_021160 [Aristolochia fimbriata]|uniref:ATP synthase protein MI25 n=1 Tax=Aristolochia fimbriata TaxID=158543 RepID=A0AAV7DQN1_ARIFI|nr:hypothetical protein H6P81_021160 [Aristolochia fimbriata]
MLDRKMLFAAILSICASSSKKISIYNEEMIVARRFIGFIIFSRKSLGKTFKATLDGRIEAIQEESQQFPNPNEVVPPESNEQQRLLRISLRICGTVVESLPTARCAPKCEKTVQALLCRNLNVKSATLPNAISSRRIRLQDDIVTGFHFSVSERFFPGCTLKASIVELIREGLVVRLLQEAQHFLATKARLNSVALSSKKYDFEFEENRPCPRPENDPRPRHRQQVMHQGNSTSVEADNKITPDLRRKKLVGLTMGATISNKESYGRSQQAAIEASRVDQRGPALACRLVTLND